MDIKKILFRTNSIDVEKALPDALVLCGKDGKIQWVNDAISPKHVLLPRWCAVR